MIDDSSRGADGVRLGDVNGDGRPDVVTGWEQGGITRIYLHPGHEAARRRWPAVTVGNTPHVEDAVFADLDGDGRTDVVSSCEGKTRTMFVHWAPKDASAYLDPERWSTEALPASAKRMMWMFCTPAQVDGRHGVDLVAAGKGADCQIGWWQAPEDARRLDQWQWHPISPAGWVMSLRKVDMDGDGDADVLTSDRKGPRRGCRWLENPGAPLAGAGPWKSHFVGGREHEVMFLTLADLDADGALDVLCATRDNGLLFFRRPSNASEAWQQHAILMPEYMGTGKAVESGEVDGDGKPDLVVTCENARDDRSGVVWLSYDKAPTEEAWTAHEISGPAGIKFDRMELLDGDGDLDVLACEESQPMPGAGQGLGVFWYENPS